MPLDSAGGWKLNYDGLDEGQRALVRYVSFMLDLRPFWPIVSRSFISWMGRQFKTEGDFGGDPWEPLDPDYLAWKSQHAPGRPILQFTGDLLRAATTPERRVSPFMLELSIVDPKIDYHQEGTDHMPARPVVFDQLPLEAALELDRLAGEYADDMARRAGIK